jgi:hypothetical protein
MSSPGDTHSWPGTIPIIVKRRKGAEEQRRREKPLFAFSPYPLFPSAFSAIDDENAESIPSWHEPCCFQH